VDYCNAFAVSGFSHFVYPKLKPFWGGSPEAVTFTLKADSGIQGSPSLKASLIDQSADGFYLLIPPATHATFVPRSAVTRINY
jgi:hypothetical protein